MTASREWLRGEQRASADQNSQVTVIKGSGGRYRVLMKSRLAEQEEAVCVEAAIAS